MSYALADRNIHNRNGSFRVLITRRPKNVYGGSFPTLEEARAIRDKLEAQLPALRPWSIRVKIVERRRTQQDLRNERLAKGMCQSCGDEPPRRPGLKTCKSCMDAMHAKRTRKTVCQPPSQ